MTLANKVTIARILLIPVFVAAVLQYRHSAEEAFRWFALACFCLAAASDGIDGWIARRFNQRSQLGAILDPLADKLLILSALILLSRAQGPHLPPMPFWLVASIIGRDIILVLGFSRIQFVCGHVHVIPKLTGKVATVLQMFVVIVTLADLPVSVRDISAVVTLVFTIHSGLQHSFDGLRQLRVRPRLAAEVAPPPAAQP